MNDDLDKIRECLTRIESLCTSPHWDSGRKNQIVELTSLAQAYVATLKRAVNPQQMWGAPQKEMRRDR